MGRGDDPVATAGSAARPGVRPVRVVGADAPASADGDERCRPSQYANSPAACVPSLLAYTVVPMVSGAPSPAVSFPPPVSRSTGPRPLTAALSAVAAMPPALGCAVGNRAAARMRGAR
ncbi:hypothetical protein [Streptomyces sp. NPDC001781]